MATALLDQRGVFAETVALATRTGASPYREALAIAFLGYVTEHFEDEELVVTAGFEAEMIRHDHE